MCLHKSLLAGRECNRHIYKISHLNLYVLTQIAVKMMKFVFSMKNRVDHGNFDEGPKVLIETVYGNIADWTDQICYYSPGE